MKNKPILVAGMLAASMLCGYCGANAQEGVPCLIFTGTSENARCLDLAKLNRITFGKDGMTVSSSKDGTAQEVSLLYSLFHHLEIGEASPSETTGLDSEALDDSRLVFHPDTKSIVIDSPSEGVFSVGVFNSGGTLLATSQLRAGQILAVDALPSGVYVAVATDGETKLTLKFVLK